MIIWKKVIAREISDTTRDELYSEPSALRIDDRNETSRYSSPQYIKRLTETLHRARTG